MKILLNSSSNLDGNFWGYFNAIKYFMVTRSKTLGLGGKPRDLLAFTGTLKTMPREIKVGYVIAMPKFTRMLKAVGRSKIRAAADYTMRVSNHKVYAQVCASYVIFPYPKVGLQPRRGRPRGCLQVNRCTPHV